MTVPHHRKRAAGLRSAILLVVGMLVVGVPAAEAADSPSRHAGMEKGLKAARSGDFKTALSEWLPLAQAGDPSAAYNVAQLYRRGQGVKQDFGEAARWYRVAAQRSHPVAQYNLAVLYSMGRGVSADWAEARHWFHLAAEQGYPPAQYNLAILDATGRGAPVNLVQAYLWLELAAAQGHREAAKTRDEIAAKMTKAQVAAAKELVRNWREVHQKKQGGQAR